jgi:hypothetical protein
MIRENKKNFLKKNIPAHGGDILFLMCS